MTPILRAAVDPKYKQITIVCASQMAKTESLFNIIGHKLQDDPAPVLYVGPTQKLVESYSEGRVMPMIRSAPELWDRLAKGKKNKVTEKFISGVRLGFGWAGSATELSGHPAALVLVDERDRMTAIKGEGDPVKLADARTSTYPDGKVIVSSTCTVGSVETEVHPDTGMEHWKPGTEEEIISPIWRLWQQGTRFEWAWPCTDCGSYFIPRFKHLVWSPEKATPEQALQNTKMACPHCGVLIDDTAKEGMNAKGRYVAPGQHVERDGTVVGAAPARTNASFWISGLCSPWRSWGRRAADFLAAVRAGDQDALQVALNTGLGELYAMGGDAPAWEAVRQLAQGYESGSVPEGVRLITCAVDVQKDRLIYGVRGWGWNNESWLIEADEIWGETAHDAVWTELDALLVRDFGSDHKIRLMLIDSGYRPGEKNRNPDNQIYKFCYRHRGRAFPTKGHDKQDRPVFASKIDISYKGKIVKNGLQLWHVDTDYCKSFVHARIEWPQGEPGGWHLPSDITDEYCQQVTAEARVVNATGRAQWIKLRKDNHYLDIEALNVAGAQILRVHAMARPESSPKDEQAAEQPRVPSPQPRSTGAPRRHGNWTTDWR